MKYALNMKPFLTEEFFLNFKTISTIVTLYLQHILGIFIKVLFNESCDTMLDYAIFIRERREKRERRERP